MEAVKSKFVGGDDLDLHAEAEKWRQKQQQDLSHDFDAVIKEEESKARTFKLKGTVYKVPRKLPVWVQTFILSKMDEQGNVGHKANLELIEKLVGEDFVKALNDPEVSKYLPVSEVNEKLIFPLIRDAGLSFGGDGGGKVKTQES